MKLYKLTDQNGQTYGGCQWGEGVEHTAPGTGELCTAGWLHAYEDPLLAVLLNSIHGDFRDPLLWEAEGEVGLRDGQLKCGCTSLKTLRQIPLPEITTEQKVRFGILGAQAVCDDPSWLAWADGWLTDKDRSQAAARAAAANSLATEAAMAAAWAASLAPKPAMAAELARAVAWAAVRAAQAADVDLVTIARMVLLG